MMTFRIRLKKARKPTQPRLRVDLEKLRFQMGHALIALRNDDMDIDTVITTYNTALADVASEILSLGKERRREKKLGSPKMFSISVML